MGPGFRQDDIGEAVCADASPSPSPERLACALSRAPRLNISCSAGIGSCEVDHLPLNLDSILSRHTTFKPILFEVEHMKQFTMLFVAAIAVCLLPTIAAADCPGGYVPCGEKNQLCCPAKP
jgi:hypothetical protein